MKDIILYIVLIGALFIAAMAAVQAIFVHNYWGSTTALVALVLLALTFYPRLMHLTSKRK